MFGRNEAQESGPQPESGPYRDEAAAGPVQLQTAGDGTCFYAKGHRRNCPGVNGGYCRHPGRCPIIAGAGRSADI